MKKLFFGVLSFSLMSCSSMNKNECLSADWYQLGSDDLAKHSRSTDYFAKREKACSKHKILANKDEYFEGWNDAIKTYCTNESLYRAGTKGHNFLYICKKDQQAELYEHYSRGKKVYQIKNEISQLEREITNLNNLKKKEGISAEEIRQYDTRINLIESDIRLLNIKINNYRF